MQEPDNNSQEVCKKIVIFCGHPCGGKTTVRKVFLSLFRGAPSFAMDDLRKTWMPGQIHNKSRRDAAYRIMHHEVIKALRTQSIIAVDASYFPTRARAEIAEIAKRFRADIYIVQCVCDAEVAVDRFLGRLRREPDHAGTDLSVSRVRDLANQYHGFDGGLTVETTNNPKPREILAILHEYILSPHRVDPCEWARHWYSALPRPQKPPARATGKLSSATLKRARGTLFWHRFAYVFIFVFLIIGGITLALYSFIRLRAEVPAWTCWRSPFHSLWNGLAASSWPDIATGATFTITATGVIGIFLVFFKETERKRKAARNVVDSGKVPMFNLPDGANETPSDREIYYGYQCRMREPERAKMPIPDIPIYFIVTPQQGKTFSVIAEKAAREILSVLQDEATKQSLDWKGFSAWRWDAWSKDYALKAKSAEKNLRCGGHLERSADGSRYTIPARFSRYSDYVVRELSVNLCAPGELPDMRRLFEGSDWDDEFLDLSNLKDAARRYSLRLSVTGIVLTNDDYFVLQRRSRSLLKK